MIEIGRAEAYRSRALEIAPPVGLRCSQPLVFELVGGGWRGGTVIEGAPQDCDRDIALHLQALAGASRSNPAWRIRIEIEPDGGLLELQAGSFGEAADDVAALVRWATTPPLIFEGAHAKLYVSVRLPDDAHRHFVDLVVRQLPATWPEPVIDASPGAIALGFELTGDASQTAQLISALRYAWLLEGSRAQCLIELEGDPAIVRNINDLHGWTTFERELRAVETDAAIEAVAVAVEAPGDIAEVSRIEIARTAPLPTLGRNTLTWIDGAGRILGLGADGILYELAERAEAWNDFGTDLARYCRRPDGASCLRGAGFLVEIPYEPEVDRQVRGTTRYGLLLTERRGADTRLRHLLRGGLHDGPLFRNVRAVVLPHGDNIVVLAADVGGSPSLVTVDLHNWGWDRGVRWPDGVEVTDLAILGRNRLLCVANLDGASQLYIIFANTGELEYAIYLPCRDPKIMHVGGTSAWITGASPGRRPVRYDLFRVDLIPPATTTVLTGSINTGGWGPLHATRRDDGWFLAYERRGLFILGETLEVLVAFDDGEHVTSICTDPPVAVFTTSPEGARLRIADHQLAVVDIPSPAYEPLLISR